MWEVVRDYRLQADGDSGTGGNAETGDDIRDGGKVVGHNEATKGEEGKTGRGEEQAGEVEEAAGRTKTEQVVQGWEGSCAGSAADGAGQGRGAG